MDHPSKKETMLFVALPGTEPYAEIPKKQVKEQLDKGVLKQSALIWSQKHNTWKQARHITQLIAAKLQPRPAQPALASQPKPAVAAQPHVAKPAAAKAPAVAQAHPGQAKPAIQAAAKPVVAVAPAVKSAAKSTVHAAENLDLMPRQKTPIWVKMICAALVVIIIGLLGINWYYVDHSLKSYLAEDKSEFADIPVYAHLAGFFQTKNLVIHIRPSDKVTRENFVDYLAALANATPNRPLTKSPFAFISLSSGWGADYHIQGYNWRRLAKADLSNEERRTILLESLLVAGGDKLIPRINLDASGQQALEVKRWSEFISTFVPKR